MCVGRSRVGGRLLRSLLSRWVEDFVKSATVCLFCSLNFEQNDLFVSEFVRAEALDKSRKHRAEKVRQGAEGVIGAALVHKWPTKKECSGMS